MDRDLPHEHDEVLDRPDPWGDIPDVDDVDSASDPGDPAASPTGETDHPPAADEPPKKERHRRRRAEHSERSATKPQVDPAPEVAADPALDDRWATTSAPMQTDHEESDPTDADPAPPPARPEPEPTQAAQHEPEPEPEPAEVATGVDHTAYIPPWPDHSLDVLPYADRSSWPGVRERGDEVETVPVLTPGGPPEPATNPGEADLEAYALPAPRAAD
ncbi:MAG: hypothetical protein WEA29_08335 [Acidimicrobiia bacterium]